MMNFRILSPLVRQYRLATPSSSSSIQRTSSSRWKCFFGVAADGTITFCGCDRDTLRANGRVRYTMLGEKQGGQFSTQLCPTQTDGTMKTIVFPKGNSGPTSPPGDELEAGYRIDLFGGGRTEAPLLGVPIFNGTAINQAVSGEITAVHNACVTFLGPAS